MNLRECTGARDIAARVHSLEARLSPALRPLAAVAFNFRWSWARDGRGVFEAIDSHAFELTGHNPVLFLHELRQATMDQVEADPSLCARIRALADEVAADLARPDQPRPGVPGPVAFLCAEYGIHRSFPIYSGGLGVLAGDILKEASDQALPMVAVGLFYRRGFFHQRLDLTGWQHEYWLTSDPAQLPMALVTGDDGQPLTLSFCIFGKDVRFRIYRVDVGRVPLFLLDTELEENDPVERWISARLYEGNRGLRLGQYALLGIGGVRALRALGIEPHVYHLNEGHPALAGLELAATELSAGATLAEGLARAREKLVFTTHTPVPAGNETYQRSEFLEAYRCLVARLGLDEETFLSLFRARPDDPTDLPGLTPFALRNSRSANAVSRLHGTVARRMWHPLFVPKPVEEVPITHVTNGVHLPSFLSRPMRELFDAYLGADWVTRSADPRTWERVRTIPNEALWQARCHARRSLVEYIRDKSEADRLLRGEQIDYVRAAARAFDPEVLTIGFARRLATYKRLSLLTFYPERALSIVGGDPPIQMLIAGKAHPLDDAGKGTVQRMFNLKNAQRVAERVVFLEDYDLHVGQQLVAGCDIWVNLPRPPMEASGTSGMKSMLNGGLQLSVLDGWWAEGFDGRNGWAISGDEDPNEHAKDARDAAAFYDIVQNEVIPLFHARDAQGIPTAFCERIKDSLVSLGPVFGATRMVDQYVQKIYPRG